MKPQHKHQPIDDLMPADTPAYMMPAWLGCISWALATPEILATFRVDSGLSWTPAASPLERMIDDATGADRQFLEAFIRWVNINVWGPINGKVA